MDLPLKGIRVVDFTHVIAGSYCSMLLADMGADVIKVERPGTGEFYREQGMKNENGVSIVYPNYNRNKRGITLNVKAPKGRAILVGLIKKADVFVENQRPGMLAEMGLGYEDFKKLNPDLVYASLSGFGQDGPYAKKTAFDMTIAAISGFMSLNGDGETPVKAGSAVSDFLSGIYTAYGVVAALYGRGRTGAGARIDVSMIDSMLSVLDAFIAQTKLTGKDPERFGNRRNGFAPSNVFPVKDGHIYIAASFQTQWESLARLMGRPELVDDPRFLKNTQRKQNEPALESIVSAWTSSLTSDEAIAQLDSVAIPCAPVKRIGEVIEDAHVKARNSIVDIDYPGIGPYPMPACPVRLSGIEPRLNRAPLLGEHNREVLSAVLKYPDAEIDELEREGVI